MFDKKPQMGLRRAGALSVAIGLATLTVALAAPTFSFADDTSTSQPTAASSLSPGDDQDKKGDDGNAGDQKSQSDPTPSANPSPTGSATADPEPAKAKPSTFDPRIEKARWLVPESVGNPNGKTVNASFFPQPKLVGAVPCGRYSQNDEYSINSKADDDVFKSLGDTLEWVNGKPEDYKIYKSHTFTYGGDCETPPVYVVPDKPTKVDLCEPADGTVVDGVNIIVDEEFGSYTIDGKPAVAGFNPVAGTSAKVVFVPKKGVEIKEGAESEWTFEFTKVACEVPVDLCKALSGSIKTTDADGAVVNGNIYTNKSDVYVYGDQFPDGVTKVYIRVTDPSGSTVLSDVKEVTVTNGSFGPVQLPTFQDSPNNGGEYKVWVSIDKDFAEKCTKFDNFKVKSVPPPPVYVVPDNPTKVDLCEPVYGPSPDGVNIPDTDMGYYTIDGTKVSAGFNAVAGTSAKVVFVPDEGVTVKPGSDSEWTFEFTKVACEVPPVEKVATAPTSQDKCEPVEGTDDTVTIPADEFFVYKLDGVEKVAGTYLVAGTSATVTAQAKDGFIPKPDSKTEWTFEFTKVACEVPPPPVYVVPDKPTKVDLCEPADGTVVDGVNIIVDEEFGSYTIDGKPAVAGFNPVAGTSAKVVFVPKKGVEIKEGAESEWTFEFTKVACEVPVEITVTAPAFTKSTCTKLGVVTAEDTEFYTWMVSGSNSAKVYTAVLRPELEGVTLVGQTSWTFDLTKKTGDKCDSNRGKESKTDPMVSSFNPGVAAGLAVVLGLMAGGIVYVVMRRRRTNIAV